MGSKPAGSMGSIRAAILISSLTWGTRGVGTRAAFDQGLDAVTLSTARAALSAVVIVTAVLVVRRGLPRSREVWLIGSFIGIVVFAGPSLLFAMSLEHASAGFVGVLVAMIPLTAAVAAHVSPLDERLGFRKLVGLLTGAGGVAFMLLSGDDGLASVGRPGLAIAYASLGAILVAGGWVAVKLRGGIHSPADLAVPQFVAGTIVLATVMVLSGGTLSGVTGRGWLLIIYLALIVQLLPFLALLWVIQRTTTSHSLLSTYITVPISVFLGVILLDEQLEAGVVVGGLLILLGVVITDRVEAKARHDRIS